MKMGGGGNEEDRPSKSAKMEEKFCACAAKGVGDTGSDMIRAAAGELGGGEADFPMGWLQVETQ
jgi:hypothetical protein